MSKFFLDTEFHEYRKQPTVCGIKVGKPIETIELISIGIVSEDIYIGGVDPIDDNSEVNVTNHKSREYYAICKEFDIKAAWDNEWLRENVLKPIAFELLHFWHHKNEVLYSQDTEDKMFTYSFTKKLINKYGKTREQIAEEIKDFIYPNVKGGWINFYEWQLQKYGRILDEYKPEFYAYDADYDWVVFRWLFGRMIDLPESFPMYCNDLKQKLDEKVSNMEFKKYFSGGTGDYELVKGSTNLPMFLDLVKGEGLQNRTYPENPMEHNARSDAKWNKKLYEFINTL